MLSTPIGLSRNPCEAPPQTLGSPTRAWPHDSVLLWTSAAEVRQAWSAFGEHRDDLASKSLDASKAALARRTPNRNGVANISQVGPTGGFSRSPAAIRIRSSRTLIHG